MWDYQTRVGALLQSKNVDAFLTDNASTASGHKVVFPRMSAKPHKRTIGEGNWRDKRG